MRRSGGKPALCSTMPVLHLDRAAHSIDDAAKLDETAVAGALDDPPVMRGDRGINQDRCAVP